MRIISSFHDYYDSVQGMGQDRNTIYLRKPTEIPNYWPWPSKTDVYWNSKIYCTTFIIGFCGKIYGALFLAKGEDAQAFCYNIDEADQFIKNNYKEKYYEAYLKKSYNKTWDWYLNHNNFVKFFEECKVQENNYKGIFETNKSPVFVAKMRKKDKWVMLNGSLKEVEFYRIKDPYTAFQDIYMYLSGVLGGNNKPVPKISDEIMLEAKGFDKKWSFRKEPAKKKVKS